MYNNRPGFSQTPTFQTGRGVVAAGVVRLAVSANSEWTANGGTVQTYKKRSLPPGAPINRSHARDALAVGDHMKPDVILDFSRD